MPKTTAGQDDVMRQNIMKGVVGLTITAAAIAAGVALSNKRNRNLVKREAKKAFKTVSNAARNLSAEAEGVLTTPIAHRLSFGKKRK